MVRKVICALDTGNLDEALATVKRLSPRISAFKIGHGLTLPHGLNVIDRLQDAGARRIFLDLKFHDIPNSVGLAVREAAKHNVWMMTLHLTGGPAMLLAALAEAQAYATESRPLLVGVSVLTSLDQEVLTVYNGVNRTIEEQMVQLSKHAIEMDLDGVVCSAHEVAAIRASIGRQGLIITPGIRLASGATHDQARVGTPQKAIADGADYLVIGRALTDAVDQEAVLDELESL